MKRELPTDGSAALDVYVRTYESLLRSTGVVEVRAFEEAHAYSQSSLHTGALAREPDLSAFAYAAARLPVEITDTQLLVLAQSHELFEAHGYAVRGWPAVKTRGRRRPSRYNNGTLAVFIASASDIDDLVPIVTAYQIEWNKMHELLRVLPADKLTPEDIADALGISLEDLDKLKGAFGGQQAFEHGIGELRTKRLRLTMRMLAPSYSQYQRAAQRWWGGVEPVYLQGRPAQTSPPGVPPNAPRRPVYFVSSNTHALVNLIGGYATDHASEIADFAKTKNPEGLGDLVREAEARGDDEELRRLRYYLLRQFLHDSNQEQRLETTRRYEEESGFSFVPAPGKMDVPAQTLELCSIRPDRVDPALRVPGMEKLAGSDAVIINIDYPLGMAAYHLLSRVGQGVGELRGVYVLGKAATLNGRVGDVMLSGNVFDEHSKNTFLFRNAFSAKDIVPYLRHGSVFDNQRALTVRSAFLQNKAYMNDFYHAGHTVLEMEAGPFLSAVYELVYPTRVPMGELVHLSNSTPFEVGILHYASDTPYSRRQSLLSKSLSYFGVDSTYACATAILRRIIEREVALASGS